MKVAVLTTSYPRYEGEPAGSFVADAVEQLRARGVDVEVVSPASFRHFGIAYGAGVMGNLRRSPWKGALVPAMLGSFARAARRAARDADLVHAHWLPAGAVALTTGKPFVVQLWGTDVELARRARPLARRVLSRVFNTVTGWLSGVRLHDMNCGLKAFRVDVARELDLYGELHRFIPVLAHDLGFRVTELGVNHRPREHGRSRYGMERYARGFLDLLTVTFMSRYRHRPLHLFGGLGLLLGTIGTGILVYLTIEKIGGEPIGKRPLLLLGVLLVVVGIQFLSLGLLSELVTSQHRERLRALDDRRSRLVDEILR